MSEITTDKMCNLIDDFIEYKLEHDVMVKKHSFEEVVTGCKILHF